MTYSENIPKILRDFEAELRDLSLGDSVGIIVSRDENDDAKLEIFRNPNNARGNYEAVLEKLHQLGYKLDDDDDSSGKRIYRKPHERPDPTQPGNAEINRLKKQFKLRLEPSLIDDIDAVAKKNGMTRQDWVEGLLKTALKDGPDIS